MLAASASRHCRASISAGERFAAGSRLSGGNSASILLDQLFHLAQGELRVHVGPAKRVGPLVDERKERNVHPLRQWRQRMTRQLGPLQLARPSRLHLGVEIVRRRRIRGFR